MRPDGVPLVGVLAPSPMGLRLDVWSTCGLKETGVGATRAVTVVVGMYVGTEATAGLVGVDCGVSRVGGGDMGGVWVIGVTTFTGLWGLGRTKDGGALTVGEEERMELAFCPSSVVALEDSDEGIVEGLEGREDGGVAVAAILDVTGKGIAAGEVVCFEEVEVEVMGTVILGVLSWTVLSGGTVTEGVATGSGGEETVFTTATVGDAPAAVTTDIQSDG